MERVEEVEIPRVQKKGFTENVLIRKFIPPVNETEEEIESYFGEEPTVLLQQDTKNLCIFEKKKDRRNSRNCKVGVCYWQISRSRLCNKR